MVDNPPNRRLLVRGFVVIVVAIALGAGVQSLHGRYIDYAASQEARYSAAQDVAKSRVATFRDNADEVSISLQNETGGTSHVFIGTSGEMQTLGNGVSTEASPSEVLAIPPHRQSSLAGGGGARNTSLPRRPTYG